MNKSKFKFSNPTLEKINFEVCDEFNAEDFDGISMEANTEVENIDERNAKVALTVNIGNNIQNQPFNICIKMQADFSWEETIKYESAQKMLRVNGATVLLSYIRPIVSNLTSSSKYPALNIPFIDFTNSGSDE